MSDIKPGEEAGERKRERERREKRECLVIREVINCDVKRDSPRDNFHRRGENILYRDKNKREEQANDIKKKEANTEMRSEKEKRIIIPRVTSCSLVESVNFLIKLRPILATSRDLIRLKLVAVRSCG